MSASDTNIFDIILALITVFGGLIATFIASILRQRTNLIRSEKEELAIRNAIIDAIEATNKTYVNSKKKLSEDGKLTADEKREAMNNSINAASEILKNRGIKLGAEIIEKRIESRLQTIKDERRKEVVMLIRDAVIVAVAATDQSYVNDLKVGGKKLTPEQRQKALEKSLTIAADLLAEEGVKVGQKILETRIEAHLASIRPSYTKEEWASKAHRLYERYSTKIQEHLGNEDIPIIDVEITLEGPPAATAGTKLFLNKTYFDKNPDDGTGALIHEYAHIAQRAPIYDDSTRWLIEGMADYIRYRIIGPSPTFDISHEKGRALDGYRTTAHFLTWLERKKVGGILELSKHLMKGSYNEKIFKEFYNKDLSQLVSEYEKAF